ncbi:hypothetical protein [Thauera butanivorans]|uniref:hypothetical protein n=1 Tax=Thauera butanivorans TaxID=86174 RepID=UPI0008383284|nr:hypothetical protein [Thauera butanivorans]
MTIHFKTPKGVGEIANRSGAIGQRARRLLILIDGQRSRAELHALAGDPDFENSLAQLCGAGFIAAAPVEPGIVPPSAGTPADDPSAQDLQKARNFMINTLRAYHGHYNKLNLIKRIESSQQRAELEALFGEWRASIAENRTGLKRVDELASQLRAVM